MKYEEARRGGRALGEHRCRYGDEDGFQDYRLVYFASIRCRRYRVPARIGARSDAADIRAQLILATGWNTIIASWRHGRSGERDENAAKVHGRPAGEQRAETDAKYGTKPISLREMRPEIQGIDFNAGPKSNKGDAS